MKLTANEMLAWFETCLRHSLKSEEENKFESCARFDDVNRVLQLRLSCRRGKRTCHSGVDIQDCKLFEYKNGPLDAIAMETEFMVSEIRQKFQTPEEK